MAMGATNLGFVYFAGAKYVGYSLYCSYLNRKSPTKSKINPPNHWWAGFVRLAIGVIVGGVYGLGYWAVAKAIPRGEDWAIGAFFIFLLPVRIAEWYLLLHLLYRNQQFTPKLKSNLVAGGIAVSFVLDFLGMITAFVLPGGAWIC